MIRLTRNFRIGHDPTGNRSSGRAKARAGLAVTFASSVSSSIQYAVGASMISPSCVCNLKTERMWPRRWRSGPEAQHIMIRHVIHDANEA